MEVLYFEKLTCLVPTAGVEPAQPKPPPPQDGVSTSSTTSAFFWVILLHKLTITSFEIIQV